MQLGTPTIASPLHAEFVREGVLTFASPLLSRSSVTDALSFECAGPREKLYFDPSTTTAAIVSCGGLCPGINNVIRALVLELHHDYRIRDILGFRFGLQGLADDRTWEPVSLGPESVRHIHRLGGSILGSSRGRRDTRAIVDTLERRGVSLLFMIGGNGTMRAASEITDEIARRRSRIAVVTVPKTIDDDIGFIDKSFGFDTAVEHARAAIDCAHTEAIGAANGIGVVKLMGRDSGAVALNAVLASGEANFCLLPEAPWKLDGHDGLLASLEQRVAKRSHAVIVVAEGCAAHIARSVARDASGNARYVARATDVGPWLCSAIEHYFAAHAGTPITLKYIDPSYMIRSAPANACDAIYCTLLAQNAVHAAMAGHTGVLVGRCHGVYVHVPLSLVIQQPKAANAETRKAATQLTGAPA